MLEISKCGYFSDKTKLMTESSFHTSSFQYQYQRIYQARNNSFRRIISYISVIQRISFNYEV